LVHLLSDKIELGDSDLKLMLKKHHEKRKHQPVRLWWEWPFVIFSAMPLICPETVLVSAWVVGFLLLLLLFFTVKDRSNKKGYLASEV
jgi:hypothetical protein